MKRVCVVSGIAITSAQDGPRLALMAKRSPACSRPDLWEYPGGKVEDGETLEAALIREMREELSVEVRVGPYLSSCTLEVEIPVVVHLFAVSLLGTPLRGMAHSELKWIHPRYAIERMPLVPSAYLLYQDVLRYV